ncbi:hypothetical protein RJ55_00362 [Drechmeria coniospora]|nr:hypothetical protein RJ55_00362 [Drechmeria coniospora]
MSCYACGLGYHVFRENFGHHGEELVLAPGHVHHAGHPKGASRFALRDPAQASHASVDCEEAMLDARCGCDCGSGYRCGCGCAMGCG